jgi:hypothetical protein
LVHVGDGLQDESTLVDHLHPHSAPLLRRNKILR